jgi:hypothetical protein
MRTGLNGSQGDGEFPNLHIWIIQMLQNNQAAADKELSDYLATKPRMYLDEWVHDIANLVWGRMSETDFLKAAQVADPKDTDKVAEGWYYAGYKRLVTGDKATAKVYFGRCARLKKVEEHLLLPHVQMENLGKSTGGL